PVAAAAIRSPRAHGPRLFLRAISADSARTLGKLGSSDKLNLHKLSCDVTSCLIFGSSQWPAA
ncbi:MAG TPA: hypothetical protein VMJ32_12160, partial [Pirellulales bacterium]|nr:hypothetical protein [Pirellulales bacterium]